MTERAVNEETASIRKLLILIEKVEEESNKAHFDKFGMILRGQQSDYTDSLESNSAKSFSKSNHRILNDMLSSQSLQIGKYKQ